MKVPMHVLARAVLGGALLFTIGCGDDDDGGAKKTQTITEIVVANADFDTLEAAVVAADLAGTLSGAGPFTVFAPTDAAFAKLPAGALDALLADKAALTDVLTYHVISGRVDAAAVVGLSEATALNGDKIAIAVVDGGVVLNGTVKVTMTDIAASNGLIHVIDAVLMPPEPQPTLKTITEIVVASDDFDTLEAAVVAADLAGTLSGAGPFTVFAPTDAAFAKLPAGALDALLADKTALTDVLTYHVVAGRVDAATVVTLSEATALNGDKITIEVVDGGVVLNGSVKVTMTDIEASNGLIHVVDAVLLPPEPEPALKTIAQLVIDSDDFDTLEAAVVAAGLAATLSSPGPFTVFAPTDAAFAKLPAGALDALLADTAALTNVLTYHAVVGRVDAATVVTLSEVTAVNGDKISIEVVAGKVILNGSVMVTATDIQASNGIVHVIDAVLMPPQTIADVVATSPDFSTLKAALDAAELTTVLDGAGPFTVFAPTDAAFALLPAGAIDGLLADKTALADVLLNHVYSGALLASDVVAKEYLVMENGALTPITTAGGAKIGGVAISTVDIETKNGIIHVIDAVVMPLPTITETVVAGASFSTLETAVVTAGLASALDGDDLFTVFAPTDAAFGEIPAATLSALVADVPALTNVLLYHVVDGVVPASIAVGLTTAAMKNGDSVALSYDAGAMVLSVNGASVTAANVWARNGVIHVIDGVLLPPN